MPKRVSLLTAHTLCVNMFDAVFDQQNELSTKETKRHGEKLKIRAKKLEGKAQTKLKLSNSKEKIGITFFIFKKITRKRLPKNETEFTD